MTSVEPVLVVNWVSKAYGPVQALADVSLEFFAGEVHAVLGENGAGKSTLMGVLSGFVRPDSGSVTYLDRPLPLGNAAEVQKMGLAMVHQHFMLVPAFTFAENLALANLHVSGPLLDIPTLSSPALERAAKVGWEVDPSVAVRGSSVGVQQRVEIVKALAHDAKVLILDEPTAVLAPGEVEELFRVVRQLRDEGRVVILIAHKLDEVLAVADRVTVLRRGQKVATVLVSETDKAEVSAWMVGELPTASSRPPHTLGEVQCALSNLSVMSNRGETAVQGVSFEVRKGEIFGIGGVDGNGQLELAEAVVGIRPIKSGRLEVKGSIGYMPQDRQADGLALTMSVRDNLLVGSSISYGSRSKGDEWASAVVTQFDVRVGGLGDPAGSLSGGNQQKTIAGRVLSQKPDLVVAMSPTRGLDLKATEFVRSQLVAAASRGAAVLLISADLDELAEVADRVKYMSRGQLYDEFLEGA